MGKAYNKFYSYILAGFLAIQALAFTKASAYIFSSTGITIEESDVTAVSGVAMNAVGSQYEILKFLGLFLLIGVAGWILSKILGIKIGGN